MQDFWQELSTGTLTSFTTSFISTTGVAVAGADDVAVAVTADSSVLFCFFLSILLFHYYYPFFKLYNIYYITFYMEKSKGYLSQIFCTK